MKQEIHSWSALLAVITAITGLVSALLGADKIAVCFALVFGICVLIASLTSGKSAGGGVSDGIPY